jgi:hypothetical protein
MLSTMRATPIALFEASIMTSLITNPSSQRDSYSSLIGSYSYNSFVAAFTN